jgi:hypothetical protein
MPKQQGAVEMSHRNLHHNLIKIVKAITDANGKFSVKVEYIKLEAGYN